jgi:predicted transcriptional regulator
VYNHDYNYIKAGKGNQDMSFDAFFSYSRTYQEVIHQITARLQFSSFNIWVDTTNLRGGDEWWQEICEAIEQSKIFVVFWSREYQESNVCMGELNYGRSLNDSRLLVVVLDEHKLPDYLDGIHYVNLKTCKDDPKEFDKRIHEIKDFIDKHHTTPMPVHKNIKRPARPRQYSNATITTIIDINFESVHLTDSFIDVDGKFNNPPRSPYLFVLAESDNKVIRLLTKDLLADMLPPVRGDEEDTEAYNQEWAKLKKLTVHEILNEETYTGSTPELLPDSTIEAALSEFLHIRNDGFNSQRFLYIPVVNEDRKPYGVVKYYDLIHQLAKQIDRDENDRVGNYCSPIKRVTRIRDTLTVREALARAFRIPTERIFVLNDDDKLVGTIATMRLRNLEHKSFKFNDDKLRDHIEEINPSEVLSGDENILDIINRYFIREGTTVLPICKKENKLEGLLSYIDILKYLRGRLYR